MHTDEEYDPSKLTNDQLIQVFRDMDRDLVPDRYEIVCQELENRMIPYKDLSQGHRNNLKSEREIGTIIYVKSHVSNAIRAIVAIAAVISSAYLYFYGW